MHLQRISPHSDRQEIASARCGSMMMTGPYGSVASNDPSLNWQHAIPAYRGWHHDSALSTERCAVVLLPLNHTSCSSFITRSRSLWDNGGILGGTGGLVDGVVGSRCQLPRVVSPRGSRILICLAWAPTLEVNK
jgi:hypothetical protein